MFSTDPDHRDVEELLNRVLQPVRSIGKVRLARAKNGLRLIQRSLDSTSLGPQDSVDTLEIEEVHFDDEGARMSPDDPAGQTGDGRVLARDSFHRCHRCGIVIGWTDSRTVSGSSSNRLCHRCARRRGLATILTQMLNAALHPFMNGRLPGDAP